MEFPVQSRLLTSNEDNIVSTADAPAFSIKNEIAWNGLLRNTYYHSNEGIITTNGDTITYEQTENGAVLKNNRKTINLPYEWALTKKTKINKNSAAEIKSQVYYDNYVYSLYSSQNLRELIITDLDSNIIKIIDYTDYTSCVISSTFKVNYPPVLFLVKTSPISASAYDNTITGYYINDLDNPILSHKTDDYIPLGEANSATIIIHNDIPHYLLGVDDIDHNRSKTFIWAEDHTKAVEYKWFGCVAPNGLITGEPIPDPDIFKYYTRNSNGTYSWDMKNGTSDYIPGQIIGGYEVPTDDSPRWSKIIIDSWTSSEQLRVNLSANDTKLNTDDIDPKDYFVTNFADSQGIYFDYGKGWFRCYVRKSNFINKTISDCYIYTYGSKKISNLKYKRESMMAKGTTAIWTYTETKLNQRVYHLGGNNKGISSLLSKIPFTVVYDDEEKLCAQFYGLNPISFSWTKSLITPGADHSDFNIQYYDDRVILGIDSIIYEIKKHGEFKLEKLADYLFATNILDNDNLLVEDSNGNISVERTAIPYHMDCVIQIEDKNLDAPSASIQAANNTVYWAAAYNSNFTEGISTSFLLPAISIPVFISSTQLTQFTTELIDERGTFIQPLIKGIFDDYESVEVFYTLSTNSTTISYKTSNIIKTTDITTDRYDLYGKATFNVDKNGWIWNITTSTIYYPIPIGFIVHGINYITPTIELTDGYSVRLYLRSNRLQAGYLYAQQVYLGSNIFTIYGSNYYYDGQGIYFTGKDNYYTSNQFVCYTLGMRFLANSGAEAYFYSDFEKRLFIFTGSQTMQPSDSLSNVGSVIDALYSSKEQMLYMLTDDNKLIIRSSTDLAAIDVGDYKINHLEGTDLGCAIYTDTGFILISPRKTSKTNKHFDFDLKTANTGANDKLLKLKSIFVILYKIADDVTITIETNSITGIERKTEKQTFRINPRDWKANEYRKQITPRNNTANAFSVRVKSEDEIGVAAIVFDFEKNGENRGVRK